MQTSVFHVNRIQYTYGKFQEVMDMAPHWFCWSFWGIYMAYSDGLMMDLYLQWGLPTVLWRQSNLPNSLISWSNVRQRVWFVQTFKNAIRQGKKIGVEKAFANFYYIEWLLIPAHHKNYCLEGIYRHHFNPTNSVVLRWHWTD